MYKATTKKIHVNQHVIRSNLANNENKPAITVKAGNQNLYGHTVNIYDEKGEIVAVVKQPKDKKLSCGARVWVETKNRIEVIDES
jgi:hypothetical protein